MKESVIGEGRDYQVKRLVVGVGKKVSLHKHLHSFENLVVVVGVARVSLADDEILLRRNESVCVEAGVAHELENAGKIPLEVVEIRAGEYLGDDDSEVDEVVFPPRDDSGEPGEEEFCVGPDC